MQENVWEELLSAYLPMSWGNSFRCECLPRLCSHLPEWNIYVSASCQGVNSCVFDRVKLIETDWNWLKLLKLTETDWKWQQSIEMIESWRETGGEPVKLPKIGFRDFRIEDGCGMTSSSAKRAKETSPNSAKQHVGTCCMTSLPFISKA